MRYWEILVFCLGISLDVFGAAVCQGTVLGELRRRRIALYCLIFCAAQVAAMEIGRLLGMLPRFASYYTVAQGLWHILGALIFFVLGVCLIGQGRPEKDRIRAPLRDHLQKSCRHRRPHEP